MLGKFGWLINQCQAPDHLPLKTELLSSFFLGHQRARLHARIFEEVVKTLKSSVSRQTLIKAPFTEYWDLLKEYQNLTNWQEVTRGSNILLSSFQTSLPSILTTCRTVYQYYLSVCSGNHSLCTKVQAYVVIKTYHDRMFHYAINVLLQVTMTTAARATKKVLLQLEQLQQQQL